MTYKWNINYEKCGGCGTCIDVCPLGIYELNNNKIAVKNGIECGECGACNAQCPEEAIIEEERLRD